MTIKLNTSPEIARLQAVIDLQREHFIGEGAVFAATRRDRLQRCIELLVSYRDPLCEALDSDFGGRARIASLMTDIVGPINTLKHVKKKLPGWMKDSRRRAMLPFNLFGAKTWVRYQPKGVVGIMGAWNFPVHLTLAPMAYALAAGNRAVLKPSELTPATAAVLAEAFAEYFDEAEVAVVNGGVELAKAFSRQPFDHLVMTGATDIGKHVMAGAAENLVPVTLELGGKSPVVVGESADIALAARRIVDGKLMNNGQVCVAPDYVLLPEGRVEAFVNAVDELWRKRFPGGSSDDLTAVINERHRQRLRDYLSDAQSGGARVITLGDRNEAARMPLSLVIDPNDSARIMQEEIFGPAMVVKTYRLFQEAIDGINRGPRPLALYYFGRNLNEQNRLLDNTLSGGVTINDVAMHAGVEDAPFGGIGASGMGHYHGVEGFREFSHARTVYKAGWFDPREKLGMFPPYTDKLEKLLERTIKP